MAPDAGKHGSSALRIGVIGAGRIGAFHVRTLLSLSGIASVTVCEADAARAAGLAAELGLPTVATAEDLIDRGLDAVVIATPTPAHAPMIRLVAEAGLPMARAATVSQGAGLSGLEFGLAIPGTVGGAVWANAGAHESTIAAVLEQARVLAADGSEAQLTPVELELGYRDSRLKRVTPGAPPEIVLAATFRLQPASAAEIKERLEEIKRWRQEHQPLGTPSAGSWFRNPLPASAGALIDAAGLKGLRIGGVSVSEKHANFLVNDQKGTATDLRRLSDRVRAEVSRRSGIELVEEVVYLGDWGDWQPEVQP